MYNKKIGILGGGQLGRMLVEASIPLALDMSVLDENIEFPAAGICTRFYEGNFSNYDDVMQFGLGVDIITVEIESVNTAALRDLQKMGKEVYPQAEILELINDKGLQKQFYHSKSLPTSAFALYESKNDVLIALENGSLAFPFVQKVRKGGYDGRGVSVINDEKDLTLLFDEPSIIEEKVKIRNEMAIIVARNSKGETATYPMVEMEFHPTANLVELLFCPSALGAKVEQEAQKIATRVTQELGIVGLLAVELFLDHEGNVLINEIAPRPHNSGHHTIEACVTSQFEQLLRAIIGLPLGNTDLIKPAVMINLLGAEGHNGKVYYKGLDEALAFSGIYPHLYNKKITKPKRKMGHVTIMHDSLEEAKKLGHQMKHQIEVISR